MSDSTPPQASREQDGPRADAAGPQRTLIILLALASLGTTLLIVLNVMVSRHRAGPAEPDDTALRGGVIEADGQAAHGPPVLFALPDFTLTERSGEPLGLSDLRGKVAIVGFIFTRCQGPCPMITSQMASLQLSLSERDDWDRIRLVTISVDPEHDTPQVLTRYAGWAHADPRQWLFLTGSRQEVWTLIQRGFKLPVGEADDNPQEPIFHSQSLVLVDPHGRVRGVYRAIDERLPDGHVAPHEREDLLAALDRVLAEE